MRWLQNTEIYTKTENYYCETRTRIHGNKYFVFTIIIVSEKLHNSKRDSVVDTTAVLRICCAFGLTWRAGGNETLDDVMCELSSSHLHPPNWWQLRTVAAATSYSYAFNALCGHLFYSVICVRVRVHRISLAFVFIVHQTITRLPFCVYSSHCRPKYFFWCYDFITIVIGHWWWTIWTKKERRLWKRTNVILACNLAQCEQRRGATSEMKLHCILRCFPFSDILTSDAWILDLRRSHMRIRQWHSNRLLCSNNYAF